MFFRHAVAATFALGCSSPSASPEGPKPATPPPARHAIVLSIDGMMPASYTEPDAHRLRVPTLRALVRDGASSPGATSVMPTVTYPSHTTMATGVRPATHGITNNKAWDPRNKNQGGWRWYAEDIAAPPLWRVARARGLHAALVNWPVTVGAQVDALVPEYWRAGTGEDLKLARAISTPGLLDAVAARFPGFWKRYTPPDVDDDASIDIAVHLLETAPPDLMLIHVWAVDSAQHDHGVWSDEARAAIEAADMQVARLIDAIDAAGIAERTLLIVASDHGFAPASKRVRPGVLLREHGLVELDDKGDPTETWKAVVMSNGGTAYVYLADPKDSTARRELERAFAGPPPGIARVVDPAGIRSRGGDPRAALALEADLDHSFSDGYTGELLPEIKPGESVATHGFAEDRADMQASLLLRGPGIGHRLLEGVSLVDVAPTAAAWLGIELPGVEGQSLLQGRP